MSREPGIGCGAIQCISIALPRFVDLSNWAVREFDVSRGLAGGRIIFSKISSGDELCAGGADPTIGELARWR